MFRITMLPAEDGDCLFVETAGATGSHRLLIDGGRQATARQQLRPLIDRLPAREGAATIDLMVLTHIDADHIEGLLDLVNRPDAPSVGEIWFNDLRHLKLAKGLQPAQTATTRRTPVLGIRQGISLAQLIASRGYRWNSAFSDGPVMIDGADSLPRIPLCSGAVLTLLGPPRAKLAALVSDWALEVASFGKKSTSVLGRRPLPVPTVDNVEAIARQLDRADTKKPNGTSIAFVIEHQGRRVMFGADAHPDDLASALRRFQPGGERIQFDAIKVPHHGSAVNNTSQLIDLLASPLWLISSDGSRHRHPDPEAIARIVLAEPRGKKLLFNYTSKFNQVWAPSELRSHFGYQLKFGKNGESSVVDLS